MAMMIGPLPYAVAAASAARVSPTEAAGADEAMPMIVSSVTPIALGSSWPPARADLDVADSLANFSPDQRALFKPGSRFLFSLMMD